MHVAADLNWFLQSIVVAFAAILGFLYLVRNTASRYFMVDSAFDSSAIDYSALDRRKTDTMAAENGAAGKEGSDSCAVCDLPTTKKCSRCKMVKYCSEACQTSHWNSEHKTKCITKKTSVLRERKVSQVSLVPLGGSLKTLKQSNKVLFAYDEFVKFFKWDKRGYPPCGLLNCGNSCFANVVLQCLAYTRPLVAYLLERGHRIECQRDDWCFLCEFQMHVERARRSHLPFSPMNILSRLPNIGGNLGYGKQEDAHEFMRFAIDTMQSVCLDEFGGEKVVHPTYQETTLIQHIFGGRLQSQVICTECKNISNQFENMMDLTVEIHGDAGSLEECLDQFTAKERLHGDNMYKCDGCDAYVMAWKRLSIQRSPNILTIALKRFQSGRFGKLNKRVTFPETLDLSPYMSESEDGNDIFNLYAVIVHVDMLNASYFGHYICYVKDFCGDWYRIDDCKVANVDLDEVLSQGAYMLLYSRICARPSCLLPTELLRKEESGNVKNNEVGPSLEQPECSNAVHIGSHADIEQSVSTNGPGLKISCEEESPSTTDAEDTIVGLKPDLNPSISNGVELPNSERVLISPKAASSLKHDNQPNPTNISLMDKTSMLLDAHNSESSSISDVENATCGGGSIGENYTSEEGSITCDVSAMDVENATCGSGSVTENYTSEEGGITCDVSAMDTTTAEVQDELNTANCSSVPEKIMNGGNVLSFPDKNIQSARKRSDEEISAVKFKPLFSPGFLCKPPRKKCMKLEDKASAKLIHLSPKYHGNNHHTNEVAKSYSSCENGGVLKAEMPHIFQNGMAPMEIDVSKNLENGDSNDQNVIRCSS